jgi:hypothetical protein
MANFLRLIAKLAIVIIGLVLIFFVISNLISSANHSVTQIRSNDAKVKISESYVSTAPFGPPATVFTPGKDLFYNMTIRRTAGQPCYVKTSWRWILHMPAGQLVMWNNDDGEFFGGDHNERLSQATKVPTDLLPGKYTLSRLSVFKCGDVADYARTVRNTDIIIGPAEKD